MPDIETNELDKYISDVADISDATGADAGADGGSNDSQPNDAGGTQSTDGTPAGKDTQDQAATGNNATPQQKDAQAQGQQQNQSGQDATQQQLRPLGDGTFADAQGNITDQTGKVIAERGFAARVYQKARRQETRIQEQDQTIHQLRAQMNESNAILRASQSYGLAMDELAQAVDYAGRIKRGDVLGVTKEIVAMAAAQGYNVTDILGKDVGDSVEMRGLRQMLDERLAPLTQQQQQERARTEAAERGRQAYQRFVSENDFAEVHAGEIAQVMQREQVNAQTAYNRLFQFATRNQLDFSQPLGPQIEARQQQLRGQQQQQNGSQQKPMPNGARTTQPQGRVAVAMADPDDDWASIISEVQRTVQ